MAKPAFDPSKPFEAATKPAFDPNAAFETPDDAPSSLESLGRGVAQGGTLKFADEIAGGAEALWDKLKGSDTPFAEAYRKHRDESRANFDAAEQANPTEFGAGEIAGGIGTGVLAAPLTGGASLGSAVALGAGTGALNALGGSNELDAQAATDALKEGALGGAFGAGGYGVGKLLGKGVSAVGNKIAGVAERGEAAADSAIAGKAADIASESVDSAKGTLGKTTADSFKGLDRAAQLLARGNLSEEEAAPLRAILEGGQAASLDKNLAGNLTTDLGSQLSEQQNARALFEAAQEQYPEELARLTAEMGTPQAALKQLAPLLKRYAAPVVGGAMSLVGKLPGGALIGAGLRPALGAAGRRATSPEVRKQLFGAFGKIGAALQSSPEKLGRYGGVLASAAQRGSDALNQTIFVLGNSDPEFQKIASELDDGAP